MLMITCLFKYTPFSPMDRKLNWFALINEVFLFAAALSLMPMSNMVREPSTRWDIGHVFIGIVCSFVVFNLLMLITIAIIFLRRNIKQRKLTKQA